ncbi:MAG: hypothetical protein JXB00_11740 [Bacteroidales bacterium]|nr:hypothetical protein [Bacteroidales bacterium]
MKTHVISLFILLFLLISISSTVSAQLFDGNRKGFLLGAGGVLGHTTIHYSSGRSVGALSFGGNLYLGYGFNEQSLLSFRYRYTWITTDSPYQGLAWTADYRHYTSKEGKFFLNGGLGPAMSIPEFGNPKSGIALYGGMGYEVLKYVFLNVDFTYTGLKDGLSGTAILASISFIKY